MILELSILFVGMVTFGIALTTGDWRFLLGTVVCYLLLRKT